MCNYFTHINTLSPSLQHLYYYEGGLIFHHSIPSSTAVITPKIFSFNYWRHMWWSSPSLNPKNIPLHPFTVFSNISNLPLIFFCVVNQNFRINTQEYPLAVHFNWGHYHFYPYYLQFVYSTMEKHHPTTVSSIVSI